MPGGLPLFSFFRLPAYSSEAKIADKEPTVALKATVEDAEEDTVEDNYEEDNDSETAPEKLCLRCKDLGLTIGHFIIDQTAEAIPRYTGRYSVNQSGTTKRRANKSFSIRTGRYPHDFATVDDLKSNRQSCGFCNLASRAIARYGHSKLADETQCYLTWEVDGRAGSEDPGRGDGLFRKFINKTRRLKLSWGENKYYGQVYLVLAVPERDTEAGTGPFPVLWQETHSLGREFSDQTEKQALMRGWLDSCVNDHKETCSDTHGSKQEFLRLIDETYFGVIDVLDMQLKSLPRLVLRDGTRYPDRSVALSYVWGEGSKEGRYVTTGATVMTHIKRGGLASAWARLPRTIQDAILLVSRLGQRYLWVDSLCIAQDNERSWKNNAKAMHLIYGHAYFTICAADGDAESGLRAAAPMLRATQPKWSAPKPRGADQHHEDDDETTTISTQYDKDIRILVTRPLEVVIHDSEWSKRAWTFQEQILSRRCLIFAEGRVYFQCRFAGISEDIWTDSKGNGWSLNRTNSPLQSPRLLKRRPIWFYMNFTQLYTSRCLTMAKDILSAFEGITRLFQENMNHEAFLFGLPTSHFDLALLWTPQTALRRRKKTPFHASGGAKCSRDHNGRCACNVADVYVEGVKFQFPSWSWCGWMGDEGTGGQVVYDEGMLDGCMFNISKWLESRTWITWFLRDDQGHLRPLRDNSGRTHRPDVHEEDRWGGYSTSQAWKPVIDDATSETFELKLPRPKSSESRNASSMGSASSQSLSTPKRQVRFASEDRTPDRTASVVSENLEDGKASSIMKYRVGNGGYFRGGSSPEPDGGTIHAEDRYPSRVLQALSNRVLDSDDVGSIIPENPFGTIREREPFVRRTTKSKTTTASRASLSQYLPLLQFRTLLMKLYISARESPNQPSSNQLCVCDVADDFGDWCGSVTVPQTWIEENQNRRMDFIAISEAKGFTRDECPVWTYYVPKERGESKWDLFYVLLLERDEEHCWWERVALGKVFKAAFETAEWAEIQLS